MPLLSPEAAAAGLSPGGEGAQWPRGPVVVSDADPDFLLLPIDVGGLYRSLDGGRHWDLAMSGWNARGANGFAIDPKNSKHVIGIGGNSMDWGENWGNSSPNGLYLSCDQAVSWKQVLAFRPGTGGALAFDPTSFDSAKNACSVVYFASYDLGLFRSDDGGATWKSVSREPIGQANATYNTTLLAVHPRTGAIYFAGKAGLFSSHDKGVTFHKLWSDGSVYGLSLPPSAPDNLYLSGTAGLLCSKDAGQTWTVLAAKGIDWKPDEPIRNITVSPADLNRMLCWVQGANWAWVRYVSHDGGATFQPIKIQTGTASHGGGVNAVAGGVAVLPYNVRNGFFAWHPTDPNLAYGLGGDWVTRSTDGGRTFAWWNNGYNGIMVGASFNFSAHEPNTVFLGFQDYNGAFTTDGGHIWNYRDVSGLGWGGHCYGGHAVDFQVMWYGDSESWGPPRRTRISRDGGNSWNLAKDAEGKNCEWSSAEVSTSDPKNRNILFASQWRSTDKGLTWSKMKDCDGVFIAAPDGRLLGRKDKTLVISTNSGASWRTLVEVPGGFNDVASDASRDRYYFASENRLKQFEKSAFTTLETPRDQYNSLSVVTVAVDPVVPDVVYVGGPKNVYASHATVCRSTDAGATWANLTTGNGPHEVAWIRVHPVTREAWMNGQCYGNWKLAPPVKLGSAPPELRNAPAAPVVGIAQVLPPPATGITKMIRDFDHASFDYPYGDWTANQLSSGHDSDLGYVQIDANEHGGAGVVLNGANIAPQGQTHLVLRARLLAGNAASRLTVNLVGSDKSVTFDLTKLNRKKFVTLVVPLPTGGKYNHIQQVQIQGVNWNASAQPLKIQIAAIGTASQDFKSNLAALPTAEN